VKDILMMNFTKLAVISALFGMAMSGLGVSNALADGMHKSIMVENAWTRARGATAKVAGAFMTLHNTAKEDDRFVSASSSIADRVEIHTTKMTDGVMKMIQVKEGVIVKAGKHVEFKPGSYHVMFLGLKGKLAEGTTFPVTLTFEKSGNIEVTVAVKSAGAMGNMSHGKDMMKHDAMKKHDSMEMKKKQ